MTVLWYLLLGVVIGVVARVILPGKENMGWIMTILLGALAAFLAGSIGQWAGWYSFPSWIGVVIAIVIAIVVIFIYTRMKAGQDRLMVGGKGRLKYLPFPASS